MRLISCHDGKLLTLTAKSARGAERVGFTTGLTVLDAMLPQDGFARGAIHEVLTERGNGPAFFFAMLLVKSMIKMETSGGEDASPLLPAHSPAFSAAPAIVWCDPAGEIYPPAVAAMGIPLGRLYLLRPAAAGDQIWAVAECLRCRGVGAVVAAAPRLSRIEARKLQLSAERGGGVGILFRTLGQSPHYAAATRWLVRPAPGERTVQRWNIQLLHGHGGQIGKTIILERSRQTQSFNAREMEKARKNAQGVFIARAS